LSLSTLANDDAPTTCAISLLAAILSNLLHEGLGHAATALLTGAKSGLLTAVAWSSDFDSRLVAAGELWPISQPALSFGLRYATRKARQFDGAIFC